MWETFNENGFVSFNAWLKLDMLVEVLLVSTCALLEVVWAFFLSIATLWMRLSV